MSTKKDLVEAHSFNKRRLVTAFTSGAPGGREVESPRHGRTLIGGLVLAILVVAGAALSGALMSSSVPDGWDKSGLVITDSGGRYFALNKTLYPVTNVTSARLATPPDDWQVNTVPDEKVAEAKKGDPFGYPSAPDILPDADHLLRTGWSSCSGSEDAQTTTLAASPKAKPATGQATFVTSGGKHYLVDGQYRYAVPGNEVNPVATQLNISSTATPVSSQWINLFDDGGDMSKSAVPGVGGNSGAKGLTSNARIGDVVTDGTGDYLVVKGGLEKLASTTANLYETVSGAHPKSDDGISTAQRSTPSEQPLANWPTATPSSFGGTVPCALLSDGSGGATTTLATPTNNDAVGGTTSSVSVESGYGALVSEASDSGTGGTYLVDGSGTSYQLTNPTGIEPYLGYKDYQPSAVPSAWLQLFTKGTSLDQTAIPGTNLGSSE